MNNETKIYDATQDNAFEGRSIYSTIKNEKDEITGYTFHILVRDQDPFTGTITREELETIHRLYSSEGSNLSQREVSREFDRFTFQEFKKILRVFGITKASSVVTEHEIAENTIEELIEETITQKENRYLKQLEKERTREIEKKYKELVKTHYDFKSRTKDVEQFFEGLELTIPEFHINKNAFNNDQTVVIYMSDMHIGAYVSHQSIYNNHFDYMEARRRIEVILNRVYELGALFGAINVVVVNLGDCIDGFNGQTTRGGHHLPQNMSNKDQWKNYIDLMVGMFKSLSEEETVHDISFYSVDGGNHDGDVGFGANDALALYLSLMNPDIQSYVSEYFMDAIDIEGHDFIFTHGKDARDMFKGLPLTINDKAENMLNEFIDSRRLNGTTINVVKGDLHQSATTFARKFRYKSVASFFGSSEWIHKNFGNTKACVDIDIVSKSSIMSDRVILN